jgi:hypothetical protein
MTDLQPPRETVVHIGDVHFWRIVINPLRLMNKRFFGNLTVLFKRRREFLMDHAEPFANAVAATGARSVLLTGDFASTSTDEEFASAVYFVRGLRGRGLAVHLLPGNHDVYTFEAFRARRFERHFAEFLPRRGYPALVSLPGGTPLILLPTVCPRHFSARGLVTPKTVDTVREMLKACGPMVLVAAHYPLLHRTHGYVSHPFRRLANAPALRKMLGESGKRVCYAAGHVHRFSHERDQDYPMLEHLTTGGFFRFDPKSGTQGEFSEIRIFPERFEFRRHVYRAGWTIA